MGVSHSIMACQALSRQRSTLRRRRQQDAVSKSSKQTRARQLMGVPGDEPFPWLKMGFWLFVCALLAVVTVVGVIIMVQQSNPSSPAAPAVAITSTTTTTITTTTTKVLPACGMVLSWLHANT